MTNEKIAPPPVLFSDLNSGQKFIFVPPTAYTPVTPGMVFMKLIAEDDSRYTAVNLTTGVQGAPAGIDHVIPVAV